jgi:hypothetical protein
MNVTNIIIVFYGRKENGCKTDNNQKSNIFIYEKKTEQDQAVPLQISMKYGLAPELPI